MMVERSVLRVYAGDVEGMGPGTGPRWPKFPSITLGHLYPTSYFFDYAVWDFHGLALS